MQVSLFCWLVSPFRERNNFIRLRLKNIKLYCIKFYRCFNTQNYINPFQNLSLGFILKIFLKFRKLQPQYSYKKYSYIKKKSVYKDPSILEKNVVVSIEGTEASGDGVLQEVYSLFWDSFLSQSDDDNEHSFKILPNLNWEDYVSIGRILTHQFVLCGMFPVKVSQALTLFSQRNRRV